MQFLYPTFLWALLAVSIPIIIHLFHFRRFKSVYFPSIKFLKEIKEETSNRSKLKNLLVLMSRILAIIALVFAFAQPFLNQGREIKKGLKHVSIYVDNSLSMTTQGDGISLVEKAKLDAIAIIEAYDQSDRFQIMTNESGFQDQRWLKKEDAIRLIEDIQTSHRSSTLQNIVNRQHEGFLLEEAINRESYLLSDFQESMFNIDTSSLDTMSSYYLMIYEGIKDANISIDSSWWVAPIPVLGQQGSLIVRIANNGSRDVKDLAINLNYRQQNFPLGKLDLSANSTAIDTLSFSLNEAGWNEAKLEISDYPIRFDDEYWVTFNVSETLPVLIVSDSESTNYLRALFTSSEIFEPEFTSLNRIDYSALSAYKMVFLEELSDLSSGLASNLKEYVENGGNLVFFPNESMALSELNSFLDVFDNQQFTNLEEGDFEVGRLNENEFVFRDVYERSIQKLKLPRAELRYGIKTNNKSTTRDLITFRDGKSMILVNSIGKGHFYSSASPLNIEKNELISYAEIFVPMLYKMAMSSNKSEKLSYTIGKDEVIVVDRKLSSSETPYRIMGAEEFIPSMRNVGSIVQLNVEGQVKEAGVYNVNNETELVKKVAFNYDRKESDPDCLEMEQLKVLLGEDVMFLSTVETASELTEDIIHRGKGLMLWKWFIIAALLFLAIEIFLLRFIKL